MKDVVTNIVENKALLLGDNHFETGAIQLASGAEVKEGAFLKRGGPGMFEVVTDTEADEAVAINPVTIKNSGASSMKVSLRACLDGKVRADMLHVNGTKADTDQIDLIRKFGFTPIYAHDISRAEQ